MYNEKKGGETEWNEWNAKNYQKKQISVYLNAVQKWNLWTIEKTCEEVLDYEKTVICN